MSCGVSARLYALEKDNVGSDALTPVASGLVTVTSENAIVAVSSAR